MPAADSYMTTINDYKLLMSNVLDSASSGQIVCYRLLEFVNMFIFTNYMFFFATIYSCNLLFPVKLRKAFVSGSPPKAGQPRRAGGSGMAGH